jgi:hypothetical protein
MMERILLVELTFGFIVQMYFSGCIFYTNRSYQEKARKKRKSLRVNEIKFFSPAVLPAEPLVL